MPADFELARDYCSYGYFLLWPNYWDPRSKAYSRALHLGSGPVLVTVTQPSARAGTHLRVRPGRPLSTADRAEVRALLARVLRLDEPAAAIAEFHRVDHRWAASGRGRLMRSPTMFEDVVKTVTSCNVTWPGTVQMNRRLCEVLGEPVPGGALAAVTHTFPTPARLARARASTLRARCRVGYRDARLIELARRFHRGDVSPAWFEDPATPDDRVLDALLELPGVGPYAAANIMQLLGRYARLPLDTESVRHGRTVLGFKGSAAAVTRRVRAHFEPFGAQAFRSYWFEMWADYERRHGPAWTWERDTTGKVFTAAQLNRTSARKPAR